MRVSRLLLVGATLALTASCSSGGGGATQGATAGSTPAPGATATPGQPGATATQPPVSGKGTSVAHIEITSGPLAGTYDATGIKFDCNTSPTGVGATFLDLEKTTGLTSMLFTSGEGGANPSKIYFQALFGSAATASGPEIVTLTPGSTSGSGTATVEDRSSTLKVTVDGTGHDGARLKATIECGPVDRR